MPRWRPPFISRLIDQDRCHLNGVAMEDGRPKFVTVMAESDEPAGWRPTRVTSGCVIDVPSGQTVARGLAMPHSSRLHGGRLWVLDSGKGLLCHVDPQRGHVEPVAAMPGYTRGLACHGPPAFVGLSRIREASVFGGVPIAEHRDELRCGVGVIELATGRTVATLQFHSGVEEIFAVEVLPGVLNPKLSGPVLDEDHEGDIWVVPAESPMSGGVAATSGRSIPSSASYSSVASAALAEPSRKLESETHATAVAREGVVCHEQGRLQEALDRLRRAAEAAPDSAEILYHLGNLQQDRGDQGAALNCYRRAVALRPDFVPARLNLGRIQRLPRDAFEVTVIVTRSASDAMALAFHQTADRFVIVPRQVAAARRQIAELELDILLFADVGMDALTQTLAYSRMAPLQAVTWGHPDTTGSPTMDYFLSSDLLEAADADEHYSERLVRLPNLATCYARPVLSGPARSRDFFGLDARRHAYLCPQTLFKFHPEFDAVLRAILESDPLADLVVLDGRVPNWTRRLRARWSRTLPDAARRVRFVASQPNADFLQLLSIADVMLDPFPFGGGNTTYEALAVGTPVVTTPGRYLRGRIAHALYRRLGLRSPVAATAEEYVSRAVRLAADPDFARQVRAEIAAARDVLFDNPDDARTFTDWLTGLAEHRSAD